MSVDLEHKHVNGNTCETTLTHPLSYKEIKTLCRAAATDGKISSELYKLPATNTLELVPARYAYLLCGVPPFPNTSLAGGRVRYTV